MIIFLLAIFSLIFIGFLYNAQKNLDYIADQLRSDEVKSNKKVPWNLHEWETSWWNTLSWSTYDTGNITGELQ